MTRVAASELPVKSQSGQGPSVILYLPPGPLFKNPGHPSHTQLSESRNPKAICPEDDREALTQGPPQHVLASLTSATVVTVNYRLGSSSIMPDESIASQDKSPSATKAQANIYRYPTPVHDTLAGFDWIQNTLKPAQLGVFGSHIGGSLALMLALTEAQSVYAVAAMEPVCDWPGLDEYCAIESPDTQMDHGDSLDQGRAPNKKSNRQNRRKPPRKGSPPDLISLLEAREQFFSSPERCFDAFASPILFLRSAGRDVPRAFPKYLTGPEYPVPTVKGPRKTTSAEQHSAPDGSLWDRDIYPDLEADESDASVNSAPTTRRRKALSRWPPYGLDYGLSGKTWPGPGHGFGRLQVTLPWVRILLSRGDLPAGLVDIDSSHSMTKQKDGGNGSTVLARQGEEMVSVMRRACFWGREKGFGERRVTLSRVNGNASVEGGSWLRSIFEGSNEED